MGERGGKKEIIINTRDINEYMGRGVDPVKTSCLFLTAIGVVVSLPSRHRALAQPSIYSVAATHFLSTNFASSFSYVALVNLPPVCR
jgi:hypothetical protein